MLKTSENPPQVHPDEQSIAAWAGPWWVGHTKARAEKAFAWDLLRGDIRYYLPMSTHVKVWGGRRRTVLLPVFTSYVFFCGDAEARYRALATDRLCQTIAVKHETELVRELSSLQTVLATGTPLNIYPYAVRGKRCRVKQGALEGTEGIVVQDADVTRLVLKVSVLNQGASLEISADLLEAAE